jgi:hypothetical protein
MPPDLNISFKDFLGSCKKFSNFIIVKANWSILISFSLAWHIPISAARWNTCSKFLSNNASVDDHYCSVIITNHHWSFLQAIIRSSTRAMSGWALVRVVDSWIRNLNSLVLNLWWQKTLLVYQARSHLRVSWPKLTVEK